MQEGETVLDDMNLEIPAGRSLALVGESGAGKTTIAQLLLRFYDPVAGQVFIDGRDIRQVTQASIRKQVGMVMQDVILLAGTIRHNLHFAKPDASDEEMIEALKNARAWDFVKEMPDGLDTILGERGNRLSGGQKQRLSIAQVFLKNPPIVIFDEATSALDTLTEKMIQQAMEELFRGRTSIVIAHRLSTIKNCDRIVLLDSGRISASDNHEGLLKISPRYQELCSRQNMERNQNLN